jgi:hypothetical protein
MLALCILTPCILRHAPRALRNPEAMKFKTIPNEIIFSFAAYLN